jgi:hypothetical protein
MGIYDIHNIKKFFFILDCITYLVSLIIQIMFEINFVHQPNKTQNMWHIGAIVNITNNKLQNILKIPFYEKSVLWQKDLKGQ